MRFTVQQIDAVFEGGEPVHLSASLRFQDRAGAAIKRSEVNHPARWGSSTLLVTQAGLAPKIWLQDLQGFTLDRVAVAAATLSGRTTAVPLASGALIAELRPVVDRADFPDREGLRVTELEVTLRRDEQVLFEGRLLPGQHAVFDDAVLVLEDIGYWVGLYVVSERGGSFLVAGFILGTIGLVWRLMLYRRELAVVWDEQGFGVAGRAEYFSDRFKTELATVKQFLER
jgi:hypothetical protein